MPEPRAPQPLQRSLASRLGEGLVMTVTMLIFRLVLVWLHVLHEGLWGTLVNAVMFGVFWVLIAYTWDRVRSRRSDR